MISYIRCDSSWKEFACLTEQLDEELNKRNGLAQSKYDKHNAMQDISTVIIAMDKDKAVACGCFKELESDCAEIKRMFVCSEYRGRGISKSILRELESWAKQLGFVRAVLETGKKQPEAIALYENSGYSRIQNYGPYIGIDNSVCFSKQL